MSKRKPKKAKDLDMEGAAKAVKEGPEAMAEFVGKDNAERAEQAAKRVREEHREAGGFENATEIRQDNTLRRIQDVAISTRIALDRATKALDYAEITLRESEPANRLTKEAKQRARDVKKAEAKLGKAIETLRKVRDDLDTTLRGARK